MLAIPDEIKELLHKDTCFKNIRIHFPNGERSDICNEQIVMDSVSFTESLCSQDTLKFGLCEASVFECEVVGVSNVAGATIEVTCEVFCPSTVEGAEWKADLEKWVYSIPYGTFVIDEAKRQADIIHRKIVAYSFMYNSLLYDVNEKTSLSVFELSEIRKSSTSVDIGIEPLLFETYPYLFNEQEYDATEKAITDSMSFGNAVSFWAFWKDGRRYTLNFYTGNGGFSKSTNEMVLIDWRYMALKGDEDLDSYKRSIVQLLRSTYPNAKAGPESGAPLFNFETAVYSINYENYYPDVSYFRHDYISSGQSNPKKFDANRGRWLIFNSGSTQGFELYRKGLKFSVFDHAYSSETDVGDPYCHFKEGAHYYTALISDIKETSYVLTANKDKYTENGFYGSIVTCSGYSFRKTVEAIDIYKLLIAYAEINGFFWNISRDNPWKIYIKQQFDLLPDNDLYPDSDLYPEGVTGGKLLPEDYQSCWYEDGYTKPFGAVRCQYKNTNNEDWIFTLYLQGYDENTPTDSYQVYELKENYIIQNSTWTESQIEAICSTIAQSVKGVTYMPVEFVGRGLPYVEAGDTFEILTGSNDSITTIVLRRTISGEMVLTDSYKSV